MNNREYRKYIKNILDILIAKTILKALSKTTQFPDDPKIFLYSSLCKISKRFSDGFPNATNANGCSYVSKEFALFKCLTETMERFSQACYRNTSLTFASFNDLKEEALNPNIYIKDPSVRKKKLGWARGFNLTKNTQFLIPAQLLYLNYNYSRGKEATLTEVNTTGAAGGFDHEFTLLQAIYEAVERDAFMTMYLTKTPPKRIEVRKIKNKVVQEIFESTKRYNLELFLFDITSDIGIPTFLAAQIDRTGLGQCIAFGAKSSLSMETAIVGSLQETYFGRTWLRTKLIQLEGKQKKIKPHKIHTLDDRGIFWASLKMLPKLDFLFSQQAQDIKIEVSSLETAQELKKVIDILTKKNIDIFYADLTLKEFRNLGFYVYKILIPKLQMLVLKESNLRRSIRDARLKNYVRYFGRKEYKLNTIPQPFL